MQRMTLVDFFFLILFGLVPTNYGGNPNTFAYLEGCTTFLKILITSSSLYSGNSSLEDAVNWIIDHENDPDIDQMPLV